MTTRSPRLSIVIPCYEAASCIETSLTRILGHLHRHEGALGSFEVVVVDDGSRDRTADIVARQFPEVKLVRHSTNRGKGAAVRSGMLAATGVFRAFTDVDLPYDLGVLETMLRYLDVKEYHLCIGFRKEALDAHAIRRSLLRSVASRAFTEFVGRLVVTGVRDTQCGFKAFRGEVADYLFGQSRVTNFAFDVEILYLAFKNDFDVKKVPVKLVRDGVSTVSVFQHGPGMAVEVLKLPIAYHRGRYQSFDAWVAGGRRRDLEG